MSLDDDCIGAVDVHVQATVPHQTSQYCLTEGPSSTFVMVKDRQNGSFVRLQEENGSAASSQPHASTSGQDHGIELQPSLAPQSSAPDPASAENYQHVSNVLGEAFYNAHRCITVKMLP